MKDCIFCKTVAGKSPCCKIYEDEKTLAILDLHPINPGRILLLPKRHVEKISDLHQDELCVLTEVLQKLVKAIEDAISLDGLNIMINQGKAAGQVISHVHWHVAPRMRGDAVRVETPRLKLSQEEFLEIQVKIKKCLETRAGE